MFAEKRSAYTEKVTETQSWADVPTCKEKGLDVQYQMLRVFMLPGKVPPEVAKYYMDLLQKVMATPEWKAYVEKNALKSTVMVGEDCAPTWARTKRSTARS